MINVNNKYLNILSNKNQTQIKDGDIVRYSVMRKLDSDKALINVMGNKVIALFKNGITEKGFALVSKKNGEITLTILKDAKSIKEARENINSQKNADLIVNINTEKSETALLLSQRGIKPSYENIKYFETILKYIPDLDINKKKFILNAMSNGVYLTVEEINTLGNIFKKFDEIISVIKNSNKNSETAEILLMLADKVLQQNNKEKLDNYISTNANFDVWFMLFDMLHGELSSDSSNMLKLLLKILSANKRNRSLKESSFMLPIPFVIEGEIKEVLLYINRNEEKRTNKQFTFIAYDNGKELCQISISKNGNDDKYLISIHFFDKKLYNKCNDIKERIESDLNNFKDIKLEINYINGVKTNEE
ncbi:hypothetical protein [uncultured Brachyspira sp.]|uniref:hypothetical protein n=1 Tax=uncultured Brachyspira sp. TaxID=221953 RepID=UPI0026168696|nr:hypothetical protein [uncultured Brachyspira sp.]